MKRVTQLVTRQICTDKRDRVTAQLGRIMIYAPAEPARICHDLIRSTCGNVRQQKKEVDEPLRLLRFLALSAAAKHDPSLSQEKQRKRQAEHLSLGVTRRVLTIFLGSTREDVYGNAHYFVSHPVVVLDGGGAAARWITTCT